MEHSTGLFAAYPVLVLTGVHCNEEVDFIYTKISLSQISKMALVTTNCKKTVAQVKREQGCQYVLNLTLYNYNTLKPCCVYRTHGVTVTKDADGYWAYCFNSGSDVRMDHSKNIEQYQNAFACTSLLKDNKNTILTYKKDQGGCRGRSAIGLTADSLTLFCSKDGTKDAQTPERLRETMRSLGCISAIMLDSGSSSSCDFNGKTITTARRVANYLCVWTNGTSVTPPRQDGTQSAKKVVHTSGSTLRVRNKPSRYGTVVGSLKNCTTVSVRSDSGGWSCIGVDRYVSSEFLR